MGVSINAYRGSLDASRLQEAINGEALAADNGLYISMADGFQTHDSKTQPVTDDYPALVGVLLPFLSQLLVLTCVMLLLNCVFYEVVGLSSCDLSSEYFGRRFISQPIPIIDLSH